LPLVEAMATGLLNVAPNITSIPELFNTVGNNIDDLKELETNDQIRGIPVKSGSTSSEWVCMGPDDFMRMRPLTNVDDAVRKLIWVYDNPDKAKVIAKRGQDWVQKYTWKKISETWDFLFQKVYADLNQEREAAYKLVEKNGKQVEEKQNAK